MKKLLTTAAMIMILVLSSCSKDNSDQQQQKKAKPEAQLVTVKVEKVIEKDLQLFAGITGKLEGITDIVYYSEVAGKVETIEKRLGDMVKKGEAIAVLDGKNYKISYDQAKADKISAEATLDAVKIKLETTEKLYKNGQISKYEYTNDQSNLKKAEAGYAGAKVNVEKAKLNYDNSKFISPVNGSITQINIKVGQFIGMGQPVASIVNCEKLVIKTGVGEKDILLIKKGNTVNVRHNGNGKVIKGIITGIGKKPDNSGTYPVEIEIDNQDQVLLPGMIIEGEIESKVLKNKIYTEFDNVVEEFSKYFVFIVNDENIVTKRKVEIENKYGNNTVIASGLEIGDKLVVSGIESLTNGVKVKLYNK
ncbi:MAG: efflux RND transporter periplasmic adaptor subunit [Candidatus Delongbacteria bacterium]|jgi:RND family efflux transporter MFP subunit|nr:efflux RND transporter periplasmic adaptor subunit [Candidatus Delongbacteria bacterium]